MHFFHHRQISKCFVFFVLISLIAIKLLVSDHRKSQSQKTNKIANNSIVCMILTSDNTIGTRGIAAWKSWAKNCNVTYFGCNCKKKGNPYANYITKNRKVLDSNDLPVINLNVEETYFKMAKKAMELLRESKEHIGLDNSWYLMADDDTFIFFDNLIRFVNSRNPKEPYVYGYKLINWLVKNGYPQGGAGIIFTRESMRRIYESLEKGYCNYTDGYSDVAVGNCMIHSNVSMDNSADVFNRNRFHMYSLKRYFEGPLDSWILNYSEPKPTHGINCCAPDSISFHYTKPDDMLTYSRLSFQEALEMEFLKSESKKVRFQ